MKPKPCDKVTGLPCLGSEGTCYGPIYWQGRAFDKGAYRRMAIAERKDCPWQDRIRKWCQTYPDKWSGK